MDFPAPIALFVYARPRHTARTLDALRRNDLAARSDLVIFADGARSQDEQPNVAVVRQIARGATGFRSVKVVERERNLGLACNIITGVTEMCEEYGRVVVLEDDLLSAPYFLRYVNDGLRIYADDTSVASIHGYMFPVEAPLPETFFLRGADCWGWATWKRAWGIFNHDAAALLKELDESGLQREFDYKGYYPYSKQLRQQADGRSDAWAARWYASAFLKGMVSLHPRYSLIHHIGSDGSGTNVRYTSSMDVLLTDRPIPVERQEPVESIDARSVITANFRRMRYLRPWHIAMGLARAVAHRGR